LPNRAGWFGTWSAAQIRTDRFPTFSERHARPDRLAFQQQPFAELKGIVEAFDSWEQVRPFGLGAARGMDSKTLAEFRFSFNLATMDLISVLPHARQLHRLFTMDGACEMMNSFISVAF
jgi:hypothetical protein